MKAAHRLAVSGLLIALLAAGVMFAPGVAVAVPPLEPSTPEEAALLVAEGVSGRLAAGASAWYEYRPGSSATGRADAVTLFFVPAIELGAQGAAVNFGIFSLGQVFSGGDVTVMSPIGAGSHVSRDGDPNTAERLWQGRLSGSDPYYVRIFNGTDLEIGYWLYPGDVDHVEMPPVTDAVAPVEPLDEAMPLDLPWPEPAAGHLEPDAVAWYRWLPAGDVGQRQESSFTMFFTPANSLFADRVACEVMTVAQREARITGQSQANTGAGRIVSRDGDPLTGERLWQGHLSAGQEYWVRIANGSEVPIDYWLFAGDVIHPQFPPPAEAAVATVSAPTPTATPRAPLPTSTPTAPVATPTPGVTTSGEAAPTQRPQPTATPTQVSPSELVPSP